MMKRLDIKGVSPVIATVLLISLVVVLALIIFLFMRGIGEEAIMKFGEENIKLACQKVSFDASYDNDKIIIRNIGVVPLYDIEAKLIEDGEGSYTTVELREISENEGENWPSGGLDAGGVAAVDIGNEGSGFSKIVLSPVLVGKTHKGAKKSYTCTQEIVI